MIKNTDTHTIVHKILDEIKGTMTFIPSADNKVCRIVYSEGATHKSLTDGKITNEDSKTGIKRARTIWDDKMKKGWRNII